MRGSLPTAPVILVRADTPGTGKSYLIDLIAMISTGRLCPVITASKSAEETEKRLGSVLLGGTNRFARQRHPRPRRRAPVPATERPVIKIRILGRSEMPECECHTAVFATGNNVTFKGDMVRRGLVCNLEALVERPELREFKQDAFDHAAANRGAYVAAVLTIIRAYLEAGAPRVCGPFGSYTAWSRMVRSPLVWLGEPDPIASMDAAREEDRRTLQHARVLRPLDNYDLDLDTDYTTAESSRSPACAWPAAAGWTSIRAPSRNSCCAWPEKSGNISAQRLGWWLRKISGRVVDGHRLVRGRRRTRRRGVQARSSVKEGRGMGDLRDCGSLLHTPMKYLAFSMYEV